MSLAIIGQHHKLAHGPNQQTVNHSPERPPASFTKGTPDSFTWSETPKAYGALRLYNMNSEGKQFPLGILGKGNVFGAIDAFSMGTRDVFIKTIDDTLLCYINKEQFQVWLNT